MLLAIHLLQSLSPNAAPMSLGLMVIVSLDQIRYYMISAPKAVRVRDREVLMPEVILNFIFYHSSIRLAVHCENGKTLYANVYETWASRTHTSYYESIH